VETGKYLGTTEILSYFLKDVRKYDVLTTDEEQKLITAYLNGDNTAKDMLVNCNLRYIYSKAKEYARDEDEVLDYVNEGVIGLLKGLENYDVSLGIKVMTYVKFHIQREMNYYFKETRDMVVPSNRSKIGSKINRIKRKYYAEHGYDIPTEELKFRLMKDYGIVITDDRDLLDVSVASIDKEIDDDYTMEENSEYNSRTATYNECEAKFNDEHCKELVSNMLDGLSDIEADIIKRTYRIGYDYEFSDEQIGIEHALETEMVQKIRENAFRKIRKRFSVKVV
jgi:RNA polymerase primary sigma factor